jgi:hypothetical protein
LMAASDLSSTFNRCFPADSQPHATQDSCYSHFDCLFCGGLQSYA